MIFNLFLATFLILNIFATLTFFTACAVSGQHTESERDRTEMLQDYNAAHSYMGKTTLGKTTLLPSATVRA